MPSLYYYSWSHPCINQDSSVANGGNLLSLLKENERVIEESWITRKTKGIITIKSGEENQNSFDLLGTGSKDRSSIKTLLLPSCPFFSASGLHSPVADRLLPYVRYMAVGSSGLTSSQPWHQRGKSSLPDPAESCPRNNFCSLLSQSVSRWGYCDWPTLSSPHP